MRSLIKLTALAGTAAPGLKATILGSSPGAGRSCSYFWRRCPLNNKIAREMIGLGLGYFRATD